MTGWPAAQQPATVVYLASNAAFVPGQNPISVSGIGTPIGHTNQILMVDTEAMCVNGPLQIDGGIPVERGCQGTQVYGHNAGTTVWVGFPSYYPLTIPRGTCSRAIQPVLPVIYIETAGVYDCQAGLWVYTGLASQARAATAVPVWHVGARAPQHWYARFGSWLKRVF